MAYLSLMEDKSTDQCDWYPCTDNATQEVVLSPKSRLVEGRYCERHSHLALADVRLDEQ